MKVRTFTIKTLGCKVNQCESDAARRHLLERGMLESRDFTTADICIVNTCCVTARAERKSRQLIRQAVRNAAGPAHSVVVTGCFPGYDREWLKAVKGIDKVFGQKEKRQFSAWLATHGGRSPGHGKFKGAYGGRTRAFLKIQDGCDRRCSYCVVPLMRGPSMSRPVRSVLAEARALAAGGHKELVLTGVNIGNFGRTAGAREPLVRLIEALEKIKGLDRIRLSSIEAGDVTAVLLRHMSMSAKVCPHLHIPFQSGDDTVLSAMNRRAKVADYLRLVDTARGVIKKLMVTCDMMVGFPMETEEHFRHTLSFIRRVRPLKVHVFPFSARAGTVAARYQALCPQVVKKRAETLRNVAGDVSRGLLEGYYGSETDVLFEQKETGMWAGYSPEYFRVFLDSNAPLHNQIRRIKIGGLLRDGLRGTSLTKARI